MSRRAENIAECEEFGKYFAESLEETTNELIHHSFE
jgi:hypothetical protein